MMDAACFYWSVLLLWRLIRCGGRVDVLCRLRLETVQRAPRGGLDGERRRQVVAHEALIDSDRQ